MPNKAYKFYSDPGHGWLAVKRNELQELNIMDQISHFSYQNGQTVYLEEDSDATLFIKAYEVKHGVKPSFIESNTDRRSAIRSYQRFSK